MVNSRKEQVNERADKDADEKETESEQEATAGETKNEIVIARAHNHESHKEFRNMVRNNN